MLTCTPLPRVQLSNSGLVTTLPGDENTFEKPGCVVRAGMGEFRLQASVAGEPHGGQIDGESSLPAYT